MDFLGNGGRIPAAFIGSIRQLEALGAAPVTHRNSSCQ